MKRRLLNLLTVICLLLSAAAVALWVRSLAHWDRLRFWGYVHHATAESAGGGVALTWGTDAPEPLSVPQVVDLTSTRRTAGADRPGSLSARCRRSALGFGYDAYDRLHLYTVNGVGASTRERVVVFPYWVAVLAFAALPTFCLVRGRAARRRRSRGLCAGCGYDLRATPGRCPECGATAPPPAG